MVAGRVWRWRRQGQGRGRGLASWQCVFPTERVRDIYFCHALYFSLWRQFNSSPICLLKHLPCEPFRKRKSWFIAVRGVDSRTSSPPSLPPALAAASRGRLVPRSPPGPAPAPGGSGLGAPGPLFPLASSSWEGLLAEATGRAGEVGSAGNVVCLLSPQLFAANK